MSRYLKQIGMWRYGAQVNREVGPLGGGLNVIYGKNEAGKSTVASFVGDVLFGWEEARGVRNRYRSGEEGRAGELVWAAEGSDETLRLVRTEEGLVGDASVADDIDGETFDTLFSLTADELRSLRGSFDVTARLLSAGAGSALDPASAFVEVERRIADTPVYRLSAELEEKRGQVKKAAERVRLHVQEDREFRDLEMNRASTAALVSVAEDELDDLLSTRAEVLAAEQRAVRLGNERDRAREELEALSHADDQRESSIDRKLLELDSPGERALRNRLDELSEERDKISRALDAAKENSAASTAAYEALCELDDEEVAASRRIRNRPWQVAVSVLLPLAFITAGIPLFVHGRQINSLSISALGASLVVVAVFLAAAASVGVFRQPAGTAELEGRRKDAQWVMLQDKKKLDACLADKEAFERHLSETLAKAGLAQAEGSLLQAASLLDEAASLRARKVENEQRASALNARLRMAQRELADIDAACARAAERIGLTSPWQGGDPAALPGRKPLSAAIDALVREKTRQRDALVDASNNMSERYGELSRELELARADDSLYRLRLEYEQIRTRLREAKHELIALMLARRILERSIATWEVRGQPEVYARAGRLLETITAGRWTGVSASSTGSLVAVAADGAERDPRHLSLGTCQQLYLALRLALLMSVENVGRNIPVLADDVLVNFDAERREGAARALAQLARKRQVVVFTCHQETIAALRRADPALVYLEMSQGDGGV